MSSGEARTAQQTRSDKRLPRWDVSPLPGRLALQQRSAGTKRLRGETTCVELDPIGFKIGLEVIVKARYDKALEVPYVFTDRVAGVSKLNQNEILNYLKQLSRLYAGKFGCCGGGKAR